MNSSLLLVALVIAYPAYYGNAHVKSYYNLTKDLPQDLKSCVANSELSDEFDLVASQVILVDKGIKDNEVINNLAKCYELLNDLENAELYDKCINILINSNVDLTEKLQIQAVSTRQPNNKE